MFAFPVYVLSGFRKAVKFLTSEVMLSICGAELAVVLNFSSRPFNGFGSMATSVRRRIVFCQPFFENNIL